MTMWMVRAGEGGYLFDDFKGNNIIAIGWQEMGDLSKMVTPEEIKKKVEEVYSGDKQRYRAITASQINRFRFEFKEKDSVVTYDPERREYLVGTIKGGYGYEPTRKEYRNIRTVEWKGSVSRDKLSAATRNTLGAISTIFEIGEPAEKELLNLLAGVKTTEASHSEEQLETIKDMTVESANEFIKDKIIHLEWDDMQRLVAGILRAMGYKTRISAPGPDRGKDIEASPDGLGLTDPHIVVQVKHKSEKIDREGVGSFISLLRKEQGHKGLYVSTGGFAKEAKYEAERANIPLTLIDLDDLVNLIVQYYDNFDPETKSLIPLTKIYWPR